MGLYRCPEEKLQDILTANLVTDVQGVVRDGKMTFAPMEPYAREILREERASAIARLAIDAAMRPGGATRKER